MADESAPIPTAQAQTLTSSEEEIIQNSPLWEADPKAIDRLMERIDSKLVIGMPKEIEWQDVEDLANYLFSQRKLFVQLQLENIKQSRKKLSGVKIKGQPEEVLRKLEAELEY